MSNPAENTEHTAEEKFFGMQTMVEPVDDNIEIEVVDDRPPEDQRPPAKLYDSDEEGASDEDLANYSENVQKRIKKLTFEKNEQRRRAEAADREREEAIRFARQVSGRTQQLEQTLASGEARLIENIQKRAELTAEKARQELRQAHETGDTDKLILAQEQLNEAQNELRNSLAYGQEYQQRMTAAQYQAQARQMQPQQQNPVPKPAPKAAQWAENNKWFGADEHKDMTALAYGIHEKLIRDEGIDPNSDEYFEKIDTQMRSRFPDYFTDGSGNGQPASGHQQIATPVAPSQRNNGAGKARTMRLTSTQVGLAKRLGLTPEQYASQLVKEMK
jgi:hypothetical protein